MPSLRAKQLLTKTARLSQKSEEKKFSRREINRKIKQIKYLADQKKISKVTLKKEISNLEERLTDIFALETKLKTKEKDTSKQISNLKTQIKELKKQLSHAKDISVRRKINKISFLLAELVAKSEIRKEVDVQEALNKISKKKVPLQPVSQDYVLTLKKIDQFQDKIKNLKESGKYDPEHIAALAERLTLLEQKFIASLPGAKGVRKLEPEEPTIVEPKQPLIKHKLLFGPQAETMPEPEDFSDDSELPLPPPPRMKGKK